MDTTVTSGYSFSKYHKKAVEISGFPLDGKMRVNMSYFS